jgi:multiple antibiotic resistance protein
MTEITTAFLAVFVAIFPIVNPPGMAPFFISATAGCSPRIRSDFAGRIALSCFVIMAVSLFIGSHVLAFFGLSLPAVQIGGGLVVMSTGWQLLHRAKSPQPDASDAASSDAGIQQQWFVPLTMPMTVGPGTISVAITLGSRAAGAPGFFLLALGGLAALLTITFLIYVCYRYGETILNRLGAGGVDVVQRLAAFILLCLGVQIVINGIVGLRESGLL